MKARQIFGWIILIGAAAYAGTKAGPVVERFSESGLSMLGFIIIVLLILGGIIRILRH